MSVSTLVVRENSFILMSSSKHLQCVVAQSSLTRLCKTVKGAPANGWRQRDCAALSRFWTVLSQNRVPVIFLTKLGILVLLRKRLRMDDVALAFDTARLTELASMTGYRKLTSLKMSSDLFIFHISSVSSPITMLRWSIVKSWRRPIVDIFKF